MNLYDEFFAITGVLNELGVRYAVVGGIAMAFHGRPRFTRDIDILVSPEDFDLARTAFDRLGYKQYTKPWTFIKTNLTLHRFVKIVGKEDLMVDVLLADAADHRQVVANALRVRSKAGLVRVATRKDIVRLKKIRNSDQDRVDIRELENDEDRKGRKSSK